MRANKGEWSEFYAFLKILEDWKLFAANKELEILENKFFIFKKVIRDETNQKRKIYEINDSSIYILNENGDIIKNIENKYIKEKTLSIFEKIKDSTSTTFTIPEAESLMQDLLCTQVKAANSKKADIEWIIFDRISNKDELLGFSVKSMVWSASTLLNAWKTTNFIYKILNFDNLNIEKINNIDGRSKIQDRLKKIVEQWWTLDFEEVSNDSFENNLRKIDTIFPIFLSEMLKDFFSWKANKISDLVDLLDKNSHLRKMYKLSKSDYEYKIKNFLVSIALWMVPSKEWDWFTKAHGWYIVVKNDWQVICYHLYNRDEFLSYLYENTKFESPSSTRHEYWSIYKKNGEPYINLNLQIRFLK